METSDEWIMNPFSFPFSFNLDKMSEDAELKDDPIDLSSNRALEMQFESKSLEENWCSTLVMFPRLCETALASLIQFMTTFPFAWAAEGGRRTSGDGVRPVQKQGRN